MKEATISEGGNFYHFNSPQKHFMSLIALDWLLI